MFGLEKFGLENASKNVTPETKEGMAEIPSEDDVSDIKKQIERAGNMIESREGHIDRLKEQIEELEGETESLSQKSAQLTEKLKELMAAREADPNATEEADIDKELEELGTLWENIKSKSPAKFMAVTGMFGAVGATAASAGYWQGLIALAASAAVLTDTALDLKEIIETYASRRSEIESKKEGLSGNLEQ